MNKKHLLLGLLAMALPSWLLAGPVSEQQARQQAQQFMTRRVQSGARKAPLKGGATLTLAAQSQAFYAYNVGRGNGFVMMSASDRTPAVLGYADEGQFNLSAAPDQLRQYVQRLSAVVEGMEQGTARPAPRRSAEESGVATPVSVAKHYIPTLVSSRWNQGDPYNQECPQYTDADGNKQTAATGCVATAMAQIVYYWKWPKATTKTMPGYSSSWNNTPVTYPEMAPTSFDWDNMQDIYNGSQSQASQKAVAHLMRALGHGAMMGYGPASGASSGQAAYALRTYFGYNPDSYYASHDKYTYQEWEDLIYNELAAGRPVLMNGDTSDLTGGHEWVCDGYDGNGLFHMNWGWGGMCDGYFLLTVMYPDQQGIGGSTSSDGYSMSQGIVVDLQPDYSGTEPSVKPEVVRNTVTNLRPTRLQLTRTATNRNFSVLVNYSAGTGLSNAYTFNCGFALYDADGQLVKQPLCQETFAISPGTWWPTRGMTAVFGKDLPDGTYYIRSISRENGTDEWLPTENFEREFIKVVITDGTTATLTVYPHTDITVQSLELEGPGTAGTEHKVKTVMTNNEETGYYQNTFLLVDGAFVSGNCIQIPGKSTRDIYFKYKPATAGQHTLQVSTSKSSSDAFYTTTVDIKAATTNNIRVQKPSTPLSIYNVNNQSSIYGNVMQLDVKVTNDGTDPYYSYVEASNWELQGNMYWKRSSQRQTVQLQPGESQTLHYVLPDMNYGSTYNFHVDTDGSNSSNLGNFTFIQGIDYWKADGTSAAAPTTGFKATSDMVAIHVPGKISVPTFTFEGEAAPNATVFYDEGAQVSSRVLNVLKRSVKNIVMGSEAESLTLTDGQPFFFPYTFTAHEATYVRPAQEGATAAMITLPFTPQSISAEGTPLSLFPSATDEGHSLAAAQFVSAQGSKVNFSLTSQLQPNQPYLLTLKGEVAGTSFDQTGRELTFQATDATVEATGSISVYTADYRLLGSTLAQEMQNVYTLSPDGRTFQLQSAATVQPFSAVFTANNAEALQVATLTVGTDGTATAIGGVRADAQLQGVVYTLSGQRVATAGTLERLPKGVYVLNGRKVVKTR